MTHPPLKPRQLQVLKARAETAGRGEAGTKLGMGEWNVGHILRSIACCADDAQAVWEHRAELEAVKA